MAKSRNGYGHIEVHHGFRAAVGMDMECQRFAWPGHIHALKGRSDPSEASQGIGIRGA